MAKNVVFVLHGIGQYNAGWMDLESSAVPVLKEASKTYSFFSGKSLDTYVEFVPVLYDDVFERILKSWSDLGKGLRDAIPTMPAFADQTVTYLQDATKDNWSLKVGADVLLYWGFRLFQQRVILRVLAQICTKVADTIAAGDDVPHYHVLAHSLGTAVAHDALHHLGTEAWLSAIVSTPLDDADGTSANADRSAYLNGLAKAKSVSGKSNPFNPADFSFESITMLSNVTGLIHTAESPYHSIVRPGTSGDTGAFTHVYNNVNHKFDPISNIGNFKMPLGWQTMGGYDVPVNYVFDSALNIHQAAHYVRDPRVHLNLLGKYVNPYTPSDDDIAQIAVFEDRYGFAKLEDGIKKDLNAILQGNAGSMTSLVKVLGQLSGSGG